MEHLVISASLKTAYDEQYTEALSKWRELGAKYKAKNIVELCGDLGIQSALEVGAGEGSILMHLDQWNFCESLSAVEISHSGLDFIRRRNITRVKEIRHFDGYSLPFKNDEFDLVILSHVLEHVEFPRLLLREIRRVSKYQVIEVPCDFGADVDQRAEHFLAYGHINIYIPVLLRFLLRTEGFSIVADKLSPPQPEVNEYNYFVNQKHPRTPIALLKLRLRHYRGALDFRLAKRPAKEYLAQAYTVLCKAGDKHLTILE